MNHNPPQITQLNVGYYLDNLPEINGDEIVYSGMSMYPTFIDGDKVIFDRFSQIKHGDVIVYPEPGGHRYIIHRVIEIQGEQVQTAGDNNRSPDSYSIDRQSIIGKVIRKRRFDVSSSVRGEIWGRIYFRYRVSIHRRILESITFGKPLYELLVRGAILGKLFAPFLDIRQVVLIKDGKTEIRLFLNNHYVGVRKGVDQPWSIRAPFRIFIDPDKLPAYRDVIREALEEELSSMRNTPDDRKLGVTQEN
ncbi:signal peptidase I [Methanospirillum lacunae]|uniref:Signal peptidase I n=1 Tax=Methanospirillum lacunae TaxID=668570 RepID=A0A2V2ND37_9EURY|nr:signal peptidase I [Methanospirillum lacunae]PWR73213.1 signal peptidase I [Methanospirillum lacunae]